MAKPSETSRKEAAPRQPVNEARPVAAVEPKKDETPVVAVEFSSAALALLVAVLNEAGFKDRDDKVQRVEIQDLAIGRVRVVTESR